MSICAYQHVHVPRPEANIITWYLTFFEIPTYKRVKSSMYHDLFMKMLPYQYIFFSNENNRHEYESYEILLFIFSMQIFFLDKGTDGRIKMDNIIMPSNKHFLRAIQIIC